MDSESLSAAELRVEEWVKRAQDDELSTEAILKDHAGAPSGACLLAHEIAEKYLKAFLVARKNWFPKIHRLDKLVELCAELDQGFSTLKDDATFSRSMASSRRGSMTRLRR